MLSGCGDGPHEPNLGVFCHNYWNISGNSTTYEAHAEALEDLKRTAPGDIRDGVVIVVDELADNPTMTRRNARDEVDGFSTNFSAVDRWADDNCPYEDGPVDVEIG